MKYIDADLLRKEIERRRLHFNKEAEKYQALNNGYSQNCYGARDALRDIENFLDTLQQEQPDVNLEKLVNEEFVSHSRTTEYGLEATYNRAELYRLIKRMALVFNARKEEQK